MDWERFKRKEFAVMCEANKEKFFEDCKANGIHVFLSEFARQRDVFIASLRYESQFSKGRYELVALNGWEVEPNRLYGFVGLPVAVYGERKNDDDV